MKFFKWVNDLFAARPALFYGGITGIILGIMFGQIKYGGSLAEFFLIFSLSFLIELGVLFIAYLFIRNKPIE